jgi:hypothetical protein
MSQPTPGGYLGSRSTTGVLSADNKYVAGSWVVTFPTQDLPPIDCVVYHIALTGPTGGFMVFVAENFYSAADRSDLNEYDPKQPMFVRRGESVSFHFKSAATPQPKVWLYLRQPGGNLE